MKQVSVGDTEVLLVRIKGQYRAFAAHCPHSGAPLAEGVLSGERVVCPWHHAGFSALSGDQEEPPGSDGLPRFEVEVDGEEVVVSVPEEAPERRVPHMAQPDVRADGCTFAILGAGAVGGAAAEALWQEGFHGRIALITGESHLPYDRTALSKAYLAGDDERLDLAREAAFYERCGIEPLTGRKVVEVHPNKREVVLEDGDALSYDKLLVATGSTPRRLYMPGSNLDGVFTLRAPEDADLIIQAARSGSRAAVVGASFIGMECAAALRNRGMHVTVVAPETVPFEHILGQQVGQMFRGMHEENGVEFELETEVDLFVGDTGLERVALKNGRELEVDFAVVGIGVEPVTDFLKEMPANRDGSIDVDAFLRVEGGDGDLYAAGDIAAFPDAVTGERERIEHWRVAQQQGRVAARNMVGREIPFEGIPFFWTRQYGQSLQCVGHAREWDEVIIDGDLGERDFLAYYAKEGQIRAVAGIGRNQALGAIEECMRLGGMPPAEEMREGSVDWPERLRQGLGQERGTSP